MGVGVTAQLTIPGLEEIIPGTLYYTEEALELFERQKDQERYVLLQRYKPFTPEEAVTDLARMASMYMREEFWKLPEGKEKELEPLSLFPNWYLHGLATRDPSVLTTTYELLDATVHPWVDGSAPEKSEVAIRFGVFPTEFMHSYAHADTPPSLDKISNVFSSRMLRSEGFGEHWITAANVGHRGEGPQFRASFAYEKDRGTKEQMDERIAELAERVSEGMVDSLGYLLMQESALSALPISSPMSVSTAIYCQLVAAFEHVAEPPEKFYTQ